MPHDGVLEHNFLLNQHIEEARRNHLAWLDISNAFGSVPHEVILNALIAAGVDREFVALVTNIYRDSTTSVCGEELTDPIAINRRVKQGCPLSGILFNLAINQVLATVLEGRQGKAILAFADDLVLLAKSAEDPQALLDTTIDELGKLTLRVNTNKCATLHISGEVATGARESTFQVKGQALKKLGDADYYKYLGKPVGFFLMKTLRQ
ncbi:retrovirus-related Pol polyprotein from type-2 retrotransposable element R2DM [Trichonephila inaurata madagascariensis]|uniref:Retrovirus-related Pol polyprotein from type-2 retrotransposable element R2DM n=1 Tax=Trichonephila inaurata madagascariensis TaxID=2747483 RepID=A0A8X6XP59_9ARAC|nr:retrovirus-related Pol polyprotein from type-2 retrotransposable element R2DM [Trichonephila inaurata madagascariensis]